jgi:hypothetical protein
LLYGLEVFGGFGFKRQASAFGVPAGVAQLFLDPLGHGAFLDGGDGPLAENEGDAKAALQRRQIENGPLLVLDPQGPTVFLPGEILFPIDGVELPGEMGTDLLPQSIRSSQHRCQGVLVRFGSLVVKYAQCHLSVSAYSGVYKAEY